MPRQKFTKKYKPTPFKHKQISRPTPRQVKHIAPIRVERRHETMPLEPMSRSKISDLSPHFLTNRIQSYLGTQVSNDSPYVSANKMATMPQNYYKLKPHLNRRLIENNFIYRDGRIRTAPHPLILSDFKDELEQLYRKYNIPPVPLSTEDEQFFNNRLTRYLRGNLIYDKERLNRINQTLKKLGNPPMRINRLRIPEFPRSPSPESP